MHTRFTLEVDQVLPEQDIERYKEALQSIADLGGFDLKVDVLHPKQTVAIRRDTHPTNPRKDWENCGVIFIKPNRYVSGDDGAADPITTQPYRRINGVDVTQDEYDSADNEEGYIALCKKVGLEELQNEPFADSGMTIDTLWEDADEEEEPVLDPDIGICLALHAYIHSGVALSHSSFTCPWDSGQIGWHYMTKETLEKEFGGDEDKALECLEAELKVFQAYIEGDVWGFEIEDEDGNHVDSCWGFYGDDLDGILSYLPEELHEQAREAWENRYA